MTPLLRTCFSAIWKLALLVATLWAAGAIYYDLPAPSLQAPLAFAYGAVMLSLLIFSRRRWWALAAGFLVVLLPWLQIRPEPQEWLPDVAQTAYAEVDGDRVTIHNVRHCDYRTELDYTAQWRTRTIDMTRIRGIDLAVNYWGSPWIAHPLVSFQIEGEEPIVFSIETRKRTGQSYSTIAGFYRQYGLIYVVSDERDVLRVRTNYRQGETVFLYRIRVTPERARAIFLSYLERLNHLHETPEFYNALTSNCTTNIRLHVEATTRHPDPWSWHMLLNGTLDALLYQRGALVGEGSFAELKSRSEIKSAALKIGDAPDFSRQIREAIQLPPEPIFTSAEAANRP